MERKNLPYSEKHDSEPRFAEPAQCRLEDPHPGQRTCFMSYDGTRMANHVVEHGADMVFQLSSLPPQAATAEPPQAATAEAPLRKKPKRAATAEALLKVKEEPENLNWDGADYGGTPRTKNTSNSLNS